jgi:hypothetical protein
MVLSRCMTMIPSVAASTAPSSWTKPCCLSTIVKYIYHGSYFDFTSDFTSEWLNISRWHQQCRKEEHTRRQMWQRTKTSISILWPFTKWVEAVCSRFCSRSIHG